jgi:hypothetical protein
MALYILWTVPGPGYLLIETRIGHNPDCARTVPGTLIPGECPWFFFAGWSSGLRAGAVEHAGVFI